MKRNRVFEDDCAPSLASVQPLDLEQLADDLELSEHVRHSVQEIVDEWDHAPPSAEPSPPKSSFSATPMRLWASIRRLWTAVVPSDTPSPQHHHPHHQPRPSAAKRNLRLRPPSAVSRSRQPSTATAATAVTAATAATATAAPLFSPAAASQNAVLKPHPHNSVPADASVDPFFAPSAHPGAHNAPNPLFQPSKLHPKPLRSTQRLARIRAEERKLSHSSRLSPCSRVRPLPHLVQHQTAIAGPPPSSLSTNATIPTTPLSTPPKSPTFSGHPVQSPPPSNTLLVRHPLSKSSSFASKVTSLSEQHQPMHTPTMSPKSPPPAPAFHTPPYELHEQLSSMSLVDTPPAQAPLDDFFDADIDDCDVAQNTFPTDDDISTMRLLRNRSQSTPEPLQRIPRAATTPTTSPERQSTLRKLRASRTVMRVAKAAVQDVERLAALRRRVTGDMRVDRRLAHLRLLQSQLRARRACLPSTEDAKDRLTGALDKLRERKRQALIEQQRRLSSSLRVSKLGDVPRNVKLPPLRRPSRRPKEQRVTSSPTNIRRTGFVG